MQREILESLHQGRGGFQEDELLEDIKEFAEKQGLIGYRIRSRHKLLPITRMEPLLMVAEDSENSDEEQRHSRRLDADQTLEEPTGQTGKGPVSHGPKYYITMSRRNGFPRLHMTGACPVQAWEGGSETLRFKVKVRRRTLR